jgi:putative transposase
MPSLRSSSRPSPVAATAAESVKGLYKAEVIHRQWWRSLEQVELATAEWVQWNQRRMHTAIDDLPYEARYCQQHEANQAA